MRKTLYHGTRAATPPTEFDRSHSHDTVVLAWLTPDISYAREYGNLGTYIVNYYHPLDIRTITKGHYRDAERT